MNKGLLMERITALCKEKGVNLTTAFEQSGVGKNFRSNLKTSNPSDKNLYLLAKYFNVSIEYLLGEETEEDLARKALGLVRSKITALRYSRTSVMIIPSARMDTTSICRVPTSPPRV